MLLVLTGQVDGTVDLVVQKLRKPFFRFNIDDSESYDFYIRPDGWQIRNPAGLSINSESATTCVWWKVPYASSGGDPYRRDEMREVARELYSWFQERSATRGNSPNLETEWGKIRQARLGRRHFQVPEAVIVGGHMVHELDSDARWVAKSQSSQLVAPMRAMFTSPVDPQRLDPNYPWLLQHRVDADQDVTILFVGGQTFAWSRDRASLSSLDWRKEQFSDPTPWVPRTLLPSEEAAVREFCREMGIAWGRLDFLSVDGRLIFLEVNPNGQWAFLDPLDHFGTISAVANYFES